MTIAEVLVGPARRGDSYVNTATRALEQIQVTELPLPPDAGRDLAKIRASSGLRLPDCCVLLSAERTHATLATFDGRLADVARRRDLMVVQ
jgi:predicted nucleic acid-binding protein